MEYKEFVRKNKSIWRNFKLGKIRNGALLIEGNTQSCIKHGLLVNALVICRARNFKPVWLTDAYSVDVSELNRSFDPECTEIAYAELNIIDKLKIVYKSVMCYKKLKYPRDVLSIKYDGMKYGDIIYDEYLRCNEFGTMRKIEKGLYQVIRRCFKRSERIKKTLNKNNVSGVLVSHAIGMDSGVLLRTALNLGLNVYSIASTLMCFKNRDVIADYPLTPTIREIDCILKLEDDKFDKLYEFVHDHHLCKTANPDAKAAFSKKNILYKDRNVFASDYKLDASKKNVFVMLHAFTDYPHSHFNGMIFDDYGDWFLQTLSFAKKNSSVNWIFKRHPLDSKYPITDICYDDIFRDSPSNVILLETEASLDTRSLIWIADTVITCLGSAGFELPAIGGVPSITAGDNFYSGLGFVEEPTTKEEYFGILSKLENVSKLSPEKRRIAKAVYIFIHYLSGWFSEPFNPSKVMDNYELHFNEQYYGAVAELYDAKGDEILEYMYKLSDKVSKESFYKNRVSVEEALAKME